MESDLALVDLGSPVVAVVQALKKTDAALCVCLGTDQRKQDFANALGALIGKWVRVISFHLGIPNRLWKIAVDFTKCKTRLRSMEQVRSITNGTASDLSILRPSADKVALVPWLQSTSAGGRT